MNLSPGQVRSPETWDDWRRERGPEPRARASGCTADEILTPDFTWYAPPQTVSVVSPAAGKLSAQDVRAYFGDDLTLSADDVIAAGDRVVIRWTLTGTVHTDHGDVPVVYTGIDIFRIENGKLAELWQNTDDYGLAQQLGEIATAEHPRRVRPRRRRHGPSVARGR